MCSKCVHINLEIRLKRIRLYDPNNVIRVETHLNAVLIITINIK